MGSNFPTRILCAVDFSAPSAAAARFASTIGRACGAQLHAVYVDVIDAPLYFTPEMVPDIQAEHRHSMSRAHSALVQFLARETGERTVDTRISDGDPATAIIEAANEIGADLIAMGTHARTGFDRFMVGSVAERVLRESSVPVLTVRGVQESSAPNTVVCPITDSAGSRLAFQKAARVAACLESDLVALHVIEQGDSSAAPDLCTWLDSPDVPKCRVQQIVKTGRAGEQILATVEERRVGLLVVASRHAWTTDKTELGTTARWVIQHSPCPVLTVVAAAVQKRKGAEQQGTQGVIV